MGFFDGIVQKFAEFSWKKNGEKWIKGGATALVAAGVPLIAKHTGVELTDEQQLALTAAIAGAIIGLSNLLKKTFPEQLGWL